MEMLLYIIPKVIPFDEMLANTRPLTASLSFYLFIFSTPKSWMENKKRKRVYKSLKLN